MNSLMSARKVTATEASRSFSDLVNRVKYGREEFIVEKAGEPFCRIVPVDEPRPLTLGGLARLVEAGTDSELADAIEEAVERGNAPTVPEVPWAR